LLQNIVNFPDMAPLSRPGYNAINEERYEVEWAITEDGETMAGGKGMKPRSD